METSNFILLKVFSSCITENLTKKVLSMVPVSYIDLIYLNSKCNFVKLY